MNNDQNILSFTPRISEKVEFPKNNSKHSENTEEPEVRETHISCVFITEKYVNKLKKPVRQNSPDLRIPGSRHRDNPEWVILTNSYLKLAGHYGGLLAH
jgi:aminoglycoside phosphotransferase family enzyme